MHIVSLKLTLQRKKRINSQYFDQMRFLSRYYHELDQELKLVRSRIQTLLQLTFPEIETLSKGKSELFLNILELFPHPDCVKQLPKTGIRNRLLANTSKKLASKSAEKKAIQLLEIAESSYPAVDEDDIRCVQLKYYAKLRQREEVIQQMAELSQERKEYQVLMSTPGIGTNTAVRLIAEIGDIHRSKTNKQLNAYAGIDIERF